MGMRRKEILPEEGARVYQPQKMSAKQKLAIAGAILLIIGLAIGGAAAIRWKEGREEAERLANAPEAPNYINQLVPLVDDIYCYKFTASISNMPFAEFLPEACGVFTGAYTDYYIEGYVDVNETGYSLYGVGSEGEREYLTSFIFNGSGGYMDVGAYYEFFPEVSDVKDRELVFSQAMQQAKYIDVPNSAFTDRDYMNGFIIEILSAVKENKGTEYAEDVTKENSYSLRFSPSVFKAYPDYAISKMFLGSPEEILSSMEFSGGVGECKIDMAFQQGGGIINLSIAENTEKHEDSLVYAVSKETLDNAVIQLRALHDQALQEAQAQETTEEATGDDAPAEETE